MQIDPSWKPTNRSGDPHSMFFIVLAGFSITFRKPWALPCASLIQSISCTLFIKSQFKITAFQGFTNPGHESPWRLNFIRLAPNICGSSIWNFLYVSILTPRILRWLLDFRKICASLWLFSHLRLGLTIGFCLSGFVTKFPFIFLIAFLSIIRICCGKGNSK